MKLLAYQLKQNSGHGVARRTSISLSHTEFVALMDADDISEPDRFAKQIPYFEKGYDVIGGQISEFSNNKVVSYRNVRLSDSDIKSDLKKRCPFNQVSVAFRKKAYFESGGYIDWFCEEDYYLWIRMFQHGFRFANLPDVLVNVRVDNSMVKRRGGRRYFLSEKKLQKYLLKEKIINHFQYFINVFKRFVGEIILVKIFPSLFIKLAHSKKNIYENNPKTIEHIDCNYKFSVCMCVYDGDNPSHFEDSLKSIFAQTLLPEELVLVIDGPINDEIRTVVLKYFKTICNE